MNIPLLLFIRFISSIIGASIGKIVFTRIVKRRRLSIKKDDTPAFQFIKKAIIGLGAFDFIIYGILSRFAADYIVRYYGRNPLTLYNSYLGFILSSFFVGLFFHSVLSAFIKLLNKDPYAILPITIKISLNPDRITIFPGTKNASCTLNIRVKQRAHLAASGSKYGFKVKSAGSEYSILPGVDLGPKQEKELSYTIQLSNRMTPGIQRVKVTVVALKNKKEVHYEGAQDSTPLHVDTYAPVRDYIKVQDIQILAPNEEVISSNEEYRVLALISYNRHMPEEYKEQLSLRLDIDDALYQSVSFYRIEEDLNYTFQLPQLPEGQYAITVYLYDSSQNNRFSEKEFSVRSEVPQRRLALAYLEAVEIERGRVINDLECIKIDEKIRLRVIVHNTKSSYAIHKDEYEVKVLINDKEETLETKDIPAYSSVQLESSVHSPFPEGQIEVQCHIQSKKDDLFVPIAHSQFSINVTGYAELKIAEEETEVRSDIGAELYKGCDIYGSIAIINEGSETIQPDQYQIDVTVRDAKGQERYFLPLQKSIYPRQMCFFSTELFCMNREGQIEYEVKVIDRSKRYSEPRVAELQKSFAILPLPEVVYKAQAVMTSHTHVMSHEDFGITYSIKQDATETLPPGLTQYGKQLEPSTIQHCSVQILDSRDNVIYSESVQPSGNPYKKIIIGESSLIEGGLKELTGFVPEESQEYEIVLNIESLPMHFNGTQPPPVHTTISKKFIVFHLNFFPFEDRYKWKKNHLQGMIPQEYPFTAIGIDGNTHHKQWVITLDAPLGKVVDHGTSKKGIASSDLGINNVSKVFAKGYDEVNESCFDLSHIEEDGQLASTYLHEEAFGRNPPNALYPHYTNYMYDAITKDYKAVLINNKKFKDQHNNRHYFLCEKRGDDLPLIPIEQGRKTSIVIDIETPLLNEGEIPGFFWILYPKKMSDWDYKNLYYTSENREGYKSGWALGALLNEDEIIENRAESAKYRVSIAIDDKSIQTDEYSIYLSPILFSGAVDEPVIKAYDPSNLKINDFYSQIHVKEGLLIVSNLLDIELEYLPLTTNPKEIVKNFTSLSKNNGHPMIDTDGLFPEEIQTIAVVMSKEDIEYLNTIIEREGEGSGLDAILVIGETPGDISMLQSQMDFKGLSKWLAPLVEEEEPLTIDGENIWEKMDDLEKKLSRPLSKTASLMLHSITRYCQSKGTTKIQNMFKPHQTVNHIPGLAPCLENSYKYFEDIDSFLAGKTHLSIDDFYPEDHFKNLAESKKTLITRLEEQAGLEALLQEKEQAFKDYAASLKKDLNLPTEGRDILDSVYIKKYQILKEYSDKLFELEKAWPVSDEEINLDDLIKQRDDLMSEKQAKLDDIIKKIDIIKGKMKEIDELHIDCETINKNIQTLADETIPSFSQERPKKPRKIALMRVEEFFDDTQKLFRRTGYSLNDLRLKQYGFGIGSGAVVIFLFGLNAYYAFLEGENVKAGIYIGGMVLGGVDIWHEIRHTTIVLKKTAQEVSKEVTDEVIENITNRIAKTITEDLVKTLPEETVTLLATELVIERLLSGGEYNLEKVINKVTAEIGDNSVDWITKRIGKEVAESLSVDVNEKLAKEIAEKIGAQITEELTEQLKKELAEKVSTLLSKELAEEVTEEVIESLSVKIALQLGKEVTEEISEQVAKQATKEAITGIYTSTVIGIGISIAIESIDFWIALYDYINAKDEHERELALRRMWGKIIDMGLEVVWGLLSIIIPGAGFIPLIFLLTGVGLYYLFEWMNDMGWDSTQMGFFLMAICPVWGIAWFVFGAKYSKVGNMLAIMVFSKGMGYAIVFVADYLWDGNTPDMAALAYSEAMKKFREKYEKKIKGEEEVDRPFIYIQPGPIRGT